jgi:transitional endoplasmic reticulum ATPase
VLLYGPPGTGKTTVGRALAHRLKGKFFLIDGTFIAGSSGFYYQIQQVFEGAKDNAPAVIFIDDADAIFEQGEEQAFYRYLLTMIDGLESESASRIGVMLTAMNVNNLPPALVRSGRVELWLEMKLPDAGARRRIIEEHLAQLPEQLRSIQYDEIVQAAEDFTGADLKRMVEDGKALYAFDRVAGSAVRTPTEYMLEAISNGRSNKTRYSQAEEAAQLNRMRQGISGVLSQATGFVHSFGLSQEET